MNNKLLKKIQKKDWKKETELMVYVILMFILGAVSPYILGYGLVLLVYIMFGLKWRTYHIIWVYEQYLVSHHLILFWRRNKLFDYKNMKELYIHRGRNEPLSMIKIHYNNDQTYTYHIESEHVEDFKNAMKQCNLGERLKLYLV